MIIVDDMRLDEVVWDAEATADRLDQLGDGLERHGLHAAAIWAHKQADGLRQIALVISQADKSA